jgi:hypothetical protein
MPEHHLSENETFIDEPITPRLGSFSAARMATGEPGLPRFFTWRGKEYEIAGVIESWRARDPGHGLDRDYLYVRKHFFRVKTTEGQLMTLYFDRKPSAARSKHKQRWHLFSVTDG